MKKIIFLTALSFLSFTVFSNPVLPDGIYLIDTSIHYKFASEMIGRASIDFNASLVEEDIQSYDPIVICTDDFVPFELAGQPFVENYSNSQTQLKVQLTPRASERLSDFTGRNYMKKMAVVINGEAVAIYKITRTVNSEIIDVLKCDDVSCKQLSKSLLKSIVF